MTEDVTPVEPPRPRRTGMNIGLGLAAAASAVVAFLGIADAGKNDVEEGVSPVVTSQPTTTTTHAPERVTLTLPEDREFTPSQAEVLGPEGRTQAFVNARTAYDSFTLDPDQPTIDFLDASFPNMLVYSPYFDSRLSWSSDQMVYFDIYAIYDNEFDTRAASNPEWILTDTEGNRLFIPFDCANGTCPQWAADIGDPTFRQHVLDQVQALVDTGYQTVFLDDVNLPMRVSDGDGDQVAPLDERTGEPMTELAWATYMVELVEEVRAEFPDLVIAHNPIWFADSPSFNSDLLFRQIDAADLIMIERGFTDPGLVAGSGVFGIEPFLAYLDLLHQLDRGLVYLDQSADDDASHERNVAGFLLMNEGRDTVGTEDLERVSPPALDPLYTIDLGAAEAPSYFWRGVLRRDFEFGVVVLNMPDAEVATLEFESDYLTTQGERVNTVLLNGGDAAILTAADR